jgi:Putative Flp pilus-assembly TadE/G-like
MVAVRCDRVRAGGERGQASLLMLGVVALLLAGVVALFAFGQALGARGKHQRGADLAAISAAQVMRELYPRLFEPPLLENGLLRRAEHPDAPVSVRQRTVHRRAAARPGHGDAHPSERSGFLRQLRTEARLRAAAGYGSAVL